MSLSENLVKPGVVGSVGAILTKLYKDSKVNFMGQVLPFWVVSGLAIGGSSMLSEIFHNYVFLKLIISILFTINK